MGVFSGCKKSENFRGLAEKSNLLKRFQKKQLIQCTQFL